MYLTRNKFRLNIIPSSTKFVQCQSTIRNALKSSTSQSIKHLWKSTYNHTNMQYDQYSSTKEVLKSFRQDQEDTLNRKLLHQGSFFSSISKFSLSKLKTIWSTCQSKLPKITIRYISNTLPTRKKPH